MFVEIKKFKVFDLEGSIIYGGISLFLLITESLAIRYNYLVHHTGIPIGGLITMFATLAVTLCISYIRFKSRKDFADQIIGYTINGTGIVAKGYVGKNDSPHKDSEFINDLSAAQVEVVNFWSSKLMTPISKFTDYMNGGLLGFTPNNIDLLVHPPTGPLLLPSNFQRWAVASTMGSCSCIKFANDTSWATVLQAAKHEFGHVCLNAAGMEAYPSDGQHKVMAAHGFKY